MAVSLLQKFLKLESSSGIVLLAAALISLVLANSPFTLFHQQFVDLSLFWVNEGLMAVFFLLVGLELKRSFLRGQLSSFSQIGLPAVAALGGMLVPAILYCLVNYDNPETLRGWAAPVATDIAFALGVLSLFARRIPIGLKVFLLALAIFDDLGAILILAIFYSTQLAYLFLFQAIVLTALLFLLNRLAVKTLTPYLLIGIWLWYALLNSGIHPTIAGVMVAFAIPGNYQNSPLERVENTLHPWVAYGIMPLFALVNAGVSLQGIKISTLVEPIVLGIAGGLFVGKQVGVFGFAWLMIRLGYAKLPDKATWLQLYGVALLCGIGFTMSLFLGTLAFENEITYLAEVKLGVIIGSILSGVVGAVVLLIACAQKRSRVVD